MKSIKEFLQEKLKPVNFAEILTVGKVTLTEADDPAMSDDPLGDASGDDQLGGGADLGAASAGGDALGGDLGGGMPPAGGADQSQDPGFDNANTEENDDEADEEDDHEDDPDAVAGIKDPDNVMLDDKPAAKSIYDFDALLKSIAAVRSAKSPDELKSIDKVQSALELIANGKKLKIEDVTFDDPEDAMELINAIIEPLDIKLKNYVEMKIKQPIILYRDQNKAEIAAKAADNDKARDAIDAMNKQQ